MLARWLLCSRGLHVIRKNVQPTPSDIAEQAIHAGTDRRLAEPRVCCFLGTRRPTPTRAVHHKNAYTETVDGVVSPGESKCHIENTHLASDLVAVAADGEMQLFW